MQVSEGELSITPPRVFSLQKLVEISYYNITRIRLVWARIWAVLSYHFIAAGEHNDEEVAMYAIDSLRQLGIKYLERAELANFTFQNDIMKPFVVIMRGSRSERIRELITQCIVQMIKSKVRRSNCCSIEVSAWLLLRALCFRSSWSRLLDDKGEWDSLDCELRIFFGFFLCPSLPSVVIC